MVKIYRNTKEYEDVPKNSVMALGNFDGMHIGHQEVIRSCLNKANEYSVSSAVLTFEPHPCKILKNKGDFKTIYSFDQKVEQISNIGIENLVVISFDEAMLQCSAEEFIKRYLVDIFNVRSVITGYNFHFGNKKSGNNKTLSAWAKQCDFSFYEVNKIESDYCDVSSSNIRSALETGSIGIVNKLLGRNYNIKSRVAEGEKIAQKIGTATANILLNAEIQYPLFGVYCVKVSLEGYEQSFCGIANLGVKPTFDEDLTVPLLEVHIFDFEEDIYGLEMNVEFLHFIRPERKFKDAKLLKNQIDQDLRNARYVFKNISNIGF